MAKNKRPELQLLPVSESLKGIAEAMETGRCAMNDDRRHSVESHLRLVINRFGYRPRETKEEPATTKDLADQVAQLFEAGDPPEAAAKEIQMMLHSVHSNLHANMDSNLLPMLKEVPKAVTILILGLFLLLIPCARALDNFNFTNNLLGSGSAIVVSSYPTNLLSTNLTITGYTTNGSIITTNGFYLGQQTGGAIGVKNFSGDGVGFFVKGYSLTNVSSLWTIKLIRSWADNPPLVIWNTNTSTIATNDWESVTPPITLAFTVNGTGPFEWGTNLDAYQLGNCTWLGIWASTNAAFGSTNIALTNVVIGLQKNIKPRSLSGGNF